MKKDMVKVHFSSDNDGDYVYIEENDTKIEPHHLLKFLRQGIKYGEIKHGMETHHNGKTQFIFEAKNMLDEDASNYLFVVDVKPKDKIKFKNYVDNIRDLCDLSIEKTKVNYTRIAAGIMTGFMLMYIAAPKFAKGLKKNIEKEEKFTYSQSQNISSEIERRKNIENDKANYINYLREQAEAGDKDAIEEYTRYILEQELKEQNAKEEQERGYSK